jgi:hypothetical protein
LQDFLGMPAGPSQLPANRPAVADRPSTGDRVNVGDRVNAGDRTNIGDRTKIGDRTEINIGGGNNLVVNRENNVNSIRNKWSNVNVNSRPFNRDYWAGHLNDPHWRWHAGWNRYPAGWCWRPCAWAAFGGWFAWNWAQPYQFDYGTTIVYRDNYVYYGDQQVGTADAYYEQAETIAQSVPEQADPAQIEWMPLGVFAIAEETATDTGMVLQLAVSKEGILAGTFYNGTTGDGRPVEGTVDQQSQRAAWRLADGTNPDLVMETGIYNLTQDECSALVHFGPEKTQTWLMVRLPEPEGGNE